MIQKNFKTLKIKQNKIIIEQGDGYGSLGIQAAKTIGKAVVDSVKQTLNLAKTTWGLTFGYVWKLGWNLYYEGPKGLKTTNQWFLENNKRNIEEMERINSRQPGNSDMTLFTGLTCPAALGFEKIASGIQSATSKTKYSRQRSWDSNKSKANKLKNIMSKIQYHNIVIAISHISHETSLDPFLRNLDAKVNDEDVKFYQDKASLKNSKTNEFILICNTLKKTLQMSRENKKKFGLNFSAKPEVGDLLGLLIRRESESEITSFITDRNLQTDVSKFCSEIVRHVDEIKEVNKILIDKASNESHRHSSTKTLLLRNNKAKVIKEDNDETNEEDNKIDKEDFYIYKDSITLNSIKWSMGSSLLLLNNADNQLKLSKLTLSLIKALITTLESEDLNSISLDEVYSTIENLKSKIKNDNKKNNKFNKNNNGSINTIKTKKITKYASDFKKSYDKTKAKFDQVNTEDEKSVVRLIGQLLLIEDSSETINNFNYNSIYEEDVSKSISIFNNVKNMIETDHSELLEFHQPLLKKLDIDIKSYTEACIEIISSIKSVKSEITSLESEIKDFTGKEKEILSNIENLTSSIESNKEPEADSHLDVNIA